MGANRSVGSLYNITYHRSGNLSTFMQNDLLQVDLGYVANGGYNVRRGSSKYDADFLEVEVEILVGTLKPTQQGSTQYIRVIMSAFSGNRVVTQGASMKVYQSSSSSTSFFKTRRPNIVMRLKGSDESKVYLKSERLWASGTLFHLNTSRAESRWSADSSKFEMQFTMRILMPPWVVFDIGSDVCYTNHTRSEGHNNEGNACPNQPSDSPYKSLCYAMPCTVRQTDWDRSNSVDLQFNGGILFPDIIGIFMSFTVDPNDKLKVGSGIVKSMVVSVSYCNYIVGSTFQALRQSASQCGQYEGFLFQASAPACSGSIPIDTCGAMASTAMDMDTLPSNVLLDDESYWSPHIRVGANWKDFMQFDFRATARVISVTVTVKKEGMKVPTKVSVEVSGTGVTWKTVVSKVALPEDGFIPVVPAQEARCSCKIATFSIFFFQRFARLMIDEYEEDLTFTLLAGVQRVIWSGCMIPKVTNMSFIHTDRTTR